MAALSATGAKRTRRLAGVLLLGLAIGGLAAAGAPESAAQTGERNDVTVYFGEGSTFDPAYQSDLASAAYSAQLFESLTAFDASLTLRPALAGSWDISDDGTQITFHLREGLTFSDGTPLDGEDVVGSWLRIIDPERPSQLSSLFLDVRGAFDYLTGAITDPEEVGIRADGLDVIVELERPGADFPAIISSPTFSIVPRQIWEDGESLDSMVFDQTLPSSGPYVVTEVNSTVQPLGYTLEANDRYWAGPPAIQTVHMLEEIGGRSPVAAFEDGDVDYVGIGSIDASWIKFDANLGPSLRVVPSLFLSYIGFTTTTPPFDDVRVRQAFGAAVDWTRLVELAAVSDLVPAEGMIPPGIPGRPGGDWIPDHDPDRARDLLAEAGYPAGEGFPSITFAAPGLPYAEAIAADLLRELGVVIRLEEPEEHFAGLHEEPPPMWVLGWIADYPGPNDFLGILLETGRSNNYGHWSSPIFDAAIEDALTTRDPDEALAAYERAMAAVQDEVPTIPIAYGDGWALSRDGLLGAKQNGLGILRLAGLAWE